MRWLPLKIEFALLEAGRQFPHAELLGIDIDPLAALTARANLAAASYADRSEIIRAHFRDTALPSIDGRTLYIGNPPYVRHHAVGARWKNWLTKESRQFGLHASQPVSFASTTRRRSTRSKPVD